MRALLATLVLGTTVLASSASFAAMTPQVRTTFIAQCQKQMYESQAVCTCMADIADKKLDDRAIAYLSLNALDPAHASALSKQMTAAELSSINHFMSTAPHQCRT